MEPFEGIVNNILHTYDALWDFPRIILTQTKTENTDWIFNYKGGLGGMLARILTFKRHYALLHEFQKSHNDGLMNPNEWGIECEYHVGAILFGMDSSLECLIFALNTLGYMKSPENFCDMVNPKILRRIGLSNIIGSDDPTDRYNPRPGYMIYFPRVVLLFKSNKELLSLITECHDVTKHRSSITTGGNIGVTRIRKSPKDPTSRSSDPDLTLEKLTENYQGFMDKLLLIVLQEVTPMFDN